MTMSGNQTCLENEFQNVYGEEGRVEAAEDVASVEEVLHVLGGDGEGHVHHVHQDDGIHRHVERPVTHQTEQAP